jgi:hypothetical protein
LAGLRLVAPWKTSTTGRGAGDLPSRRAAGARRAGTLPRSAAIETWIAGRAVGCLGARAFPRSACRAVHGQRAREGPRVARRARQGGHRDFGVHASRARYAVVECGRRSVLARGAPLARARVENVRPPRARDALAPVCRAESNAVASGAIRSVVVQRRVRSVSVIVDLAWWTEPATSVIARCGDDTPDGAHGAGRGPRRVRIRPRRAQGAGRGARR